MSSFIVENKTINRVLSYLHSHPDILNGYLVEKFQELCYRLDTERDLNNLGTAMMILNALAVSQRYDEPVNTKAIDEYKFKFEQCSKIQALKSLQCFLYQCAEGNVPEKPLYKLLRDVEFRLAIDIIDSLDEYNKAEWG